MCEFKFANLGLIPCLVGSNSSSMRNLIFFWSGFTLRLSAFFQLTFLLLSSPQTEAKVPDNLSCFIGTTEKEKGGIYQIDFDSANGRFSSARLVAKASKPNFLTLHPHLPKLYAVASWEKSSGIIGYDISIDNNLTEFFRTANADGPACHIAVHPTGRFLLTAQYGGGSVALFPLDPKGKMGTPIITEHSGGAKVHGNRQNSPHPHWCGFSPCGKYALVPDLGLDRAVIYKVDQEALRLVYHGEAIAAPGSGPRHLRFSKDGKLIYLLNELDLSVHTFAWDAKSGRANSVSIVHALTEEIKSKESFNSAAEIVVHPSGSFLYTSNRGHDSITAYRLDKMGEPEVIQVQPIRGAFPRNFNLTPDGNWLIACGQHSHTLSAHKVDSVSGNLTYLKGAVAHVPEPSCLVFKR
jgi:6-phosphogluconolactonase